MDRRWTMVLISGIALIILAIIFIMMVIIMNLVMDPQKKEQIKGNEILSQSKMYALMRYANDHLYGLNNKETNDLNNEIMMVFAKDYMSVSGGYNIAYNNGLTILNRNQLDQVVKYIFDKTIDYSKVSFEIKQDTVYIPEYPDSTDVKTYKFNRKEYDETTGIYTAYIDCVEGPPSYLSTIRDTSNTEYKNFLVTSTLIFKYIVKDGRNVLIGFDIEVK